MIDKNRIWRKSPTKNGKLKTSFVLYYDNCISVMEKLGDGLEFAEWAKLIVNYECYGEQPEEQVLIDKYGMKKAVAILSQFETTKEKLDMDFSKWQDQCIANQHGSP